jgi:hypothetical protein
MLSRRLFASVAERHDQVEDRRAVLRVFGIDKVVSLALELVALLRFCGRQRWLDARALDHLQRARLSCARKSASPAPGFGTLKSRSVVEAQRR